LKLAGSWSGDPDALANAIGYAKHRSRSHDAVIRVYHEAGNVNPETGADRRVQRVAFPGSKLIGLVRNPVRLASV